MQVPCRQCVRMAFMHLLRRDDSLGAASNPPVPPALDWISSSTATMQPRTPALIPAPSRQAAPLDGGTPLMRRMSFEQHALQLRLPTVQMDAIAYEQLAGLSGMSRTLAAQPTLLPQYLQQPTLRRQGSFQPYADAHQRQPQVAGHGASYAELQPSRLSLWPHRQGSMHGGGSLEAILSYNPGHSGVPYGQLGRRASLATSLFQLQPESLQVAAAATVAEAEAAAQAAAREMVAVEAAAAAAAQRLPSVQRSGRTSRVHKALEILDPGAHTLGDLAATVGAGSLAEVNCACGCAASSRCGISKHLMPQYPHGNTVVVWQTCGVVYLLQVLFLGRPAQQAAGPSRPAPGKDLPI